MIQQQTILGVSDNSGAKLVKCIKVLGGLKKKKATVGDIVVVSVLKLRNKFKVHSKVKKGEVYKALVTKIKFKKSECHGFYTWCDGNSVSLLTKQGKLVGNRVLGLLMDSSKLKKYIKITSVSGGII